MMHSAFTDGEGPDGKGRQTMTHNPAFEGARWAYAAYTLNPKIAAERGITQADMIGFASVPYKSEPRA